MEPATFRESDAMLVDGMDAPTAFQPQHHRHPPKRGFTKFARGLMPSNRNLQMGSNVLNSRPSPLSPNPVNSASYSNSPVPMSSLSPTPNNLKNMNQSTPKRKPTGVFRGVLHRVINLTRKRQRTGDSFDEQIAGSDSSQYASTEESANSPPAKKTPRRGTFWPSSLLFAPPGLERHPKERNTALPNQNLSTFSSPQLSPVIPSLGLDTPRPDTPRSNDGKKLGHFRIGRFFRPSVDNSSKPLKRNLSVLKDLVLPDPFEAHSQATYQPQADQMMGNQHVPVSPQFHPGNALSESTIVPVAQPMLTGSEDLACSDPGSFFYDGQEPGYRCESPEQLPGCDDQNHSGQSSSPPMNVYGYGRLSSCQYMPVEGGVFANRYGGAA